MTTGFYVGRRLSYDGSLCTVCYIGVLAGTKGDWLGVEWDDTTRGKHDGTHKGQRIFACRSSSPTAASFVRPTRKPDTERTILEAIEFKYSNSLSDANGIRPETVVISGKVAEEVGFEKIAKKQAQLADLRVILLDQLVVNGIAPRDAPGSAVAEAQKHLFQTCPNIREIDIGWDTIERWQDIADICKALPNLKTLKACGLRLRSVDVCSAPSPFAELQELHLEDCSLDSDSVACLMDSGNHFSSLREIRLAGNGFQDLTIPEDVSISRLDCVELLGLERNNLKDLNCLGDISKYFPHLTSLSLQANQISQIGRTAQSFPLIKSLNLSDNQIQTYQFFNEIPKLLPNLTSLQVTGNPLFRQKNSNDSDNARNLDKSFYLTLARLPNLKTLNYTTITSRERQEGELYYLAIVDKELQDLISKNLLRTDNLKDHIEHLHPLYLSLAAKHERDTIFDKLASTDSTAAPNGIKSPIKPSYPAGSLGARLITATFYLAIPDSQSQTSRATPTPTLTISLPSTLPVTQLMSLLTRHATFRHHLRPLRFDMIYESTEFDPVDTTTESTTRSALYGLSQEEKERVWKQWGEWDIDGDADTIDGGDGMGQRKNGAIEEAEGNGGIFQIRNGRRWKRREVKIPHSLKRAWGDWLDGEEGREVVVRLERLP